MRAYDTIKIIHGVNQKPDGEISPGFQEVQNLEPTKLGSVEAIKINDEPTTYGTSVHSLIFGGLTSQDSLLSGVGTNLYRGLAVLKNDFSGKNFEGDSLVGRIYLTNESDGLWSWGGSGVYRAGSPTPAVGAFAATNVAGGTTGEGLYNIQVTYQNANGFDGDPSTSITVTLAAAEQISLTDIPVNSDSDYNVSARKIWIQGGTGGGTTFSSFSLAATISDNTTTTLTFDPEDADAATSQETDNELPIASKYIAEHYNVMFMAGQADANLLSFSKTAEAENWPTGNAIRVSNSGDPIMWIESWDGVLWVYTRARVFQVIGSPGSGTLITNFYLKQSRSMKGTVSGRSVTHTPYGTFFLAEDGIRRFDGNESFVFSNPIQEEIDSRNSNSEVEEKTVGAFWDDKLVVSFATGSSTSNNHTVIYDFRAQQAGVEFPWYTHNKGYNDFAVDRKNNLLYCATSSGIERFRRGMTYEAWELEKQFPVPADRYHAYGKFQIDMVGEATANIYYNDSLAQSYALSQSSRGLVTRRFPSGLAQRATLELIGAASTSKAEVFSIGYSAEEQRGQV